MAKSFGNLGTALTLNARKLKWFRSRYIPETA